MKQQNLWKKCNYFGKRPYNNNNMTNFNYKTKMQVENKNNNNKSKKNSLVNGQT